MNNYSITPGLIKKIHKKIQSDGGIISKNLSWILLIPGDYSFKNDIDQTFTWIPTFMELHNIGLLMSVFYHPYEDNNLLLLPSLQPVFILAKKIKNNIYMLDLIKYHSFPIKLNEMKLNLFNDYKIGI